MARILGAIELTEAARLRRLAGRVAAIIGGLIRHQRKLKQSARRTTDGSALKAALPKAGQQDDPNVRSYGTAPT